MPRNASGVYSLPALNPVAGGTVITAAWANPTMEDLGNELTNSLDRSGRGGMLVPFQNASGSVGAPGITWTDEPTSGFYREAIGDMRASLVGVQATRWIDDSGTPVGERKPFQIWDGATWKAAYYEGSNLPLVLGHDVFLTGVDAALTGTVDIVKVNANDAIEFGVAQSIFNDSLLLTAGSIFLDASTDTAVSSNAGVLELISSSTVGLTADGAAIAIPGTLSVTGAITGTLTGNADTADSATTAGTAGTVTTAAQPAITSVGVLTALTVSGTINGSISGSAATVTSAAQPAITSVGTLTTLKVGDLSGTGTRPVSAQADGELVVGSGPAIVALASVGATGTTLVAYGCSVTRNGPGDYLITLDVGISGNNHVVTTGVDNSSVLLGPTIISYDVVATNGIRVDTNVWNTTTDDWDIDDTGFGIQIIDASL